MADKSLLDIREAAEFIGISIDTLRRWDKNSKLLAIRGGGKGSHRFYRKSDLELFLTDHFALGKNWAFSANPTEPADQFYCSDLSIFQARLNVLASNLNSSYSSLLHLQYFPPLHMRLPSSFI